MAKYKKNVIYSEIELDDDFDHAIVTLEKVIGSKIQTTMPFSLSFGGIRMKIRTRDELYIALGMLNGSSFVCNSCDQDLNLEFPEKNIVERKQKKQFLNDLEQGVYELWYNDQKLERQFKNLALAYTGLTGHKKGTKAYNLAHELANNSGLDCVLAYLNDLAKLIK